MNAFVFSICLVHYFVFSNYYQQLNIQHVHVHVHVKEGVSLQMYLCKCPEVFQACCVKVRKLIKRECSTKTRSLNKITQHEKKLLIALAGFIKG